MSEGFGGKLKLAFDQFGHLCVGIDPHPFLLKEWGFEDKSADVREFSLRIIDACAGSVGIIKPQVAFFERYGSRGYEALEYVMERARNTGILVIADAKRGDIGSTMEAYAQSWLASGVALEADALTVSPYLGVGALQQTVDIALANDKGVFVLAATSNSEAAVLQSARATHWGKGDSTVAAEVLSAVAEWSTQRTPDNSVGAVLGATLDLGALGIDPAAYPALPVLAPGFGFQGARVEDAKAKFGPLAENIIVSETRSVLSAGREGIDEAIKRRVDEVGSALA
jgi:orotidine-5'-phosphate decarboxylase